MPTALLVIDPQKIYTDEESEMYCTDAAATVDRINSLIDAFSKRNLPIFFCRHVHRADGSDLGRMFDYLGEAAEDFNFKDGSEEVEYDARLTQPLRARHFTKNRYSAFVETPLSTLLDEANVDTLVICGFMTNFCCDSTAREAHDRDYFVDFVVDATGTPGTETLDENEIREVVSDLLGEGYARVVTTAELLHAL